MKCKSKVNEMTKRTKPKVSRISAKFDYEKTGAKRACSEGFEGEKQAYKEAWMVRMEKGPQ